MKTEEFEIIHIYTTTEAIADGILMPIDETITKEAGIVYPVYFTRTVWDKYVEVPNGMEGLQDITGRLWDILLMFAIKARRCPSSVVFFQFICQVAPASPWERHETKPLKNHATREVHLKALCTPRDFNDPTPAIFIMKPHED